MRMALSRNERSTQMCTDAGCWAGLMAEVLRRCDASHMISEGYIFGFSSLFLHWKLGEC